VADRGHGGERHEVRRERSRRTSRTDFCDLGTEGRRFKSSQPDNKNEPPYS